MTNLLLDTKAYANMLRGNETVYQELEASDQIYMSVIVIAELLTGFRGVAKENQNIEILNEFLSNPKILTVDATIKSATIFSEIKYFLKQKGTPIPVNDIWIAAHSYEYQATIITFDKHFKNIPKIKVWEVL
jgi:tRNA(fMet)-specific endonuclease VapC